MKPTVREVDDCLDFYPPRLPFASCYRSSSLLSRLTCSRAKHKMSDDLRRRLFDLPLNASNICREGSAKITRKELIKREQNPESTSVMSSTRGESWGGLKAFRTIPSWLSSSGAQYALFINGASWDIQEQNKQTQQKQMNSKPFIRALLQHIDGQTALVHNLDVLKIKTFFQIFFFILDSCGAASRD